MAVYLVDSSTLVKRYISETSSVYSLKILTATHSLSDKCDRLGYDVNCEEAIASASIMQLVLAGRRHLGESTSRRRAIITVERLILP